MIVGIDLGTTNSLISFWENNESCLIPNSKGNFLTPSIVYLDSSGHIAVGKPEADQPSIAVFKRYMGTCKTFKLGEHEFKPEELSALVLKSLIRDAEIYLNTKITEAVITVPAYFNDTQRKATRLAGELAGLKVERLLNEPTAAALAYGIHHKNAETKFLIFDLGGGTFDVSIVELFEGIIEVRSSAGDNRLGGEDFTDLLEEFIHQQLFQNHQIRSIDLENQSSFRSQIQKLLHQLSEKDRVVFQIIHQDKTIEISITQNQFNHLVQPLISRLKKPLEKALRDARIHPQDLDKVILVGGATRMPIIGEEVAKMFGKFPLSILHPDEAIALGAGVQAALKSKHQELEDVVITDVCPYSLGVGVIQNSKSFSKDNNLRFFPIIERNTTIPTSKVETLCTTYDNQSKIHASIYQGESYRLEDNIKIGEITVSVPPRPAEQETIDVRYTYDINGLLEVEVTVISTGKKSKLIINNQNTHLSEEEIAYSLSKLSSLKVHPLDQVENRRVLNALEHLFTLLKEEERSEIARQITMFQDVLNSQNQEQIEEGRKYNLDLLASYQSLLENSIL